MKKKLELYGTLGPCCHSKDILKQMFLAGMTGLRLNLSHTTLSDCREWLQNVYEVSEEMHRIPDLLVDLQGPELRIGILPTPIFLSKHSDVRLVCSEDQTPPHPLTIPIPAVVFPHLKKKQILRFDDGNLLVCVKEVHADSREATATVLTEGQLFSRKSLAIDGVSIDLPTLTSQDLENLDAFRQYRVTGVMLPFVRGKEDLLCLKEALLHRQLAHIRIFAKIENKRGVEQLPFLLPYCDQIVIARGDLGNAYPLSQLPAIQKQISRICSLSKKPFMVVTQMLASMTEHPVPTRAEVHDIFQSVLDGASSLMLTGETAAGQYPVQAMQVLSDTSFEALRYQMNCKFSL